MFLSDNHCSGQRVKRKVGSGQRPPLKRTVDLGVFLLGRYIAGRILKMAHEEGNVMPNSNKIKLPYPPKKERIEESDFCDFDISRLLKATPDQPRIKAHYSYVCKTWRKYCNFVKCSRYQKFGFLILD